MKRNKTILVVDDDVQTLRMLNRIFELEGYNIVTATDGKSALELLDEHTPDLVLLDIMMPVVDGFNVLKLMRQRSNIPVIMLTARCEESTLCNALLLGADDYVRKPFRTRELVARVRAKLRRASPRVTLSV